MAQVFPLRQMGRTDVSVMAEDGGSVSVCHIKEAFRWFEFGYRFRKDGAASFAFKKAFDAAPFFCDVWQIWIQSRLNPI